MGSEKLMLPSIDFSSKELKPGTSTWECVKAEVRRSLEEFGCFITFYDKIPEKTRRHVFHSLAEFFGRPSEGDAGNISDKVYEGFIGAVPSRSPKEILSIDAEKVDPQVQSSASLGDTIFHILANTTFGFYNEILLDYIEAVSELEKTIRTMVLESFGLVKYNDEHMNSIDYSFRFMKYKPSYNTNKTELGLSSHVDKNLLSILDQYGTNGLEVLTKDDQWIEVNFPPNSYCILVGEIFSAWTNGRLPAPYHRVMMNSGKTTRYTIGIFSNYKLNCTVKAPDELVDEDHPQKFKPFEVSGFMAFIKQAGYQSTLKEYCGV